MRARRKKHKRKKHLSPKKWAHGFASKWFLLIAGFFSVLKLSGLENIPKQGGAVVVANHLSYFDAVALAAALDQSKRDVMVLAKSELFSSKFRGNLMRAVGVIPVYRGTERAADALEEAISSLRGGEIVALFPEGTIPKDGALLPFKTGAVRMAMEAGVPIIPVAMVGTDYIVASNLRKIKRTLFKRALVQHPVRVSIGKPVYFKGDPTDAATVKEHTEELRARMVSALRTLDSARGEGPKLASNKKLMVGSALTIPVVGGLLHIIVLLLRRKR